MTLVGAPSSEHKVPAAAVAAAKKAQLSVTPCQHITSIAPVDTVTATEEDTTTTANTATATTTANTANTATERHEEHQYLDLIRRILSSGSLRQDRTGTGTKALFGYQTRWSLANNQFPLLTTKRVFFRGVAEELLWFLRADTNAKNLADRGVKIWDGHGSIEHLHGSLGLTHREEGDLGPVYGWQWRHFGGTYRDMHQDASGEGVDQLRAIIDALLDPARRHDRRLVLSAWNPRDHGIMALPPCHVMAQFFVNDRDELSCQMYQRSCDMGLGVPFNIASYALLTVLMAHVTGLRLGEFIHCMGDAHVYLDHVDALEVQLAREPRPFPTLRLREGASRDPDMKGFSMDDIILEGYKPHPKIAMNMSV